MADEEYAEREEVVLLRRLIAIGNYQTEFLANIAEDLATISDTLATFLSQWEAANATPPGATRLSFTISAGTNAKGAVMPFTVDTTTGLATFAFTDDKNDPAPGPTDSVTSAPVVPGATVDNPAVATIAAAVADATVPGLWTAAVTPVAVGVATFTENPLVNSDGTDALDSQGNPFAESAPVQITVGPGPANTLTMTITS